VRSNTNRLNATVANASPNVNGIADACVTDLYWRPLYPQMWLHAFLAALAPIPIS
jgi:hypothetical protein